MLKDQPFIPVVIGSDMGSYAIARTFHEQYGVVSKTFSMEALRASGSSKIVDRTIIPDLNKDTLFEALRAFGEETKGIKKIVLACAEWYVDLILARRHELNEDFVIPFIEKSEIDILIRKDDFYRIAEKTGVAYPETVVVDRSNYKDVSIPWEYPVILKCSDTNEYHLIEFEGKKKIYHIESKEHLDDILEKIYTAGYDDTICIQKKVPGDDFNMRVLTCYVDKNHDVVFSCLGQPVLEVKTPGMIGNYAAIITRPMVPEILEQAKAFLKETKYIGFANFDIKYDSSDDTYKFFELNARLGRSNFYMTACGANYSKYVVEEYVYGKEFTEETVSNAVGIYSFVPDCVIKKYVSDKAIVKEYLELRRAGKMKDPIDYEKDRNFSRWLYAKGQFYNQIRVYKKYYFSSDET